MRQSSRSVAVERPAKTSRVVTRPVLYETRSVNPARPVRVVLIEDHFHTRRALVASLNEEPERVRVAGAYESAEAFLEQGKLVEFDVALVDLGLPGMGGCELIREISKTRPSSRAVALTLTSQEESVLAAVQNGAFGYLLKGESIERLLQAIEEAAAGQYPFSSRAAGALVRSLGPSPASLLTARELELARLLADGVTYARCAQEMQIKLSTVQTHVKNLYAKLEINSRRELRAWAARHLSE